MPTYDYSCPKCGLFEKFQGIRDKKLAKCPECDSPVKRMIGKGCGVHFKGSGWPGNDMKKGRAK